MPVYQSSSSSSHPYLYLPDGWDTGWKAAKAAGTPRLLLYGDSITVGMNASNVVTGGWASLLKATILSRLGISCVAEYWANGNTGATAHPWSLALNGASFSTFPGFGWHAVQLASSTQTSIVQTYTTPDACTAFDVIVDDWTAGTWQFLVDSGTAGNAYNWALSGNGSGASTTNTNVTVTNLGVGTAAGAVLRRLSITGLPSGIHTFSYGWQSVAYTASMIGAAHYPNAGNGLKFSRMACGGQTAYAFSSNPNKPSNALRLLAGFTPQQDGQTTKGFGFPVQSDLAVVSLGVNDCSLGGAAQLSATEQALQRVVQALRANNSAVSVLFLVNAYPNADTSDTSTGFANQSLWSQFVGAMYRVGSTEGCAVANLHARWGELPGASGFLNNGIHPTNAGHQDIATFISSIL